MAVEAFRQTSLPAEAPKRAFVSPTMDRWGSITQKGPLPTMVSSVQEAISREGLDDSWMIIGDASQATSDETRDHWMKDLDRVSHPSRVFILRPEFQAQVADTIQQRTGLQRPVIDAILTNTGYASQRQKLDVVIAAAVLNGTPIDTLTLDDDTVIPHEYGVLKQEVLPPGLTRQPNSQVLWPGKALPTDALDMSGNTINGFFKHLGKNVGEVRKDHPSMRATQTWVDTMHATLEDLNGHPVQFVVTHTDEGDVPNAQDAKIVAAAATKHGVPDYRTVRIADLNLRREFPQEEMPVKSYPSGPNNLFAFMECNTNVDSAALARRLDSQTALWPWWFVSSDTISRQNPLQTVTGHYRADNELLPVLLKVIEDRTGQRNMYLSGIDTQVYHNRALSGYRPNLHEQAAASLVGNVVALAAAEKLDFDAEGKPTLRLEGHYTVPEERAMKVYQEMNVLAHTCLMKATELAARSSSSLEEQAQAQEKVGRYHDIYRAIEQKLAGFNFKEFYTHLEVETNKQLQFYADVLYATPIVIAEVQKLVKGGQYPVLEWVPQKDRNTHFSKTGTVYTG